MTQKSLKKTITLEYPVQFDGENVTELHMRRPVTSDEIRKAERAKCGQTDIEVQTRMFADMCDVGYDLLMLTDLVDQRRIVDGYNDFFPKAVEVGTKSQTPAT